MGLLICVWGWLLFAVGLGRCLCLTVCIGFVLNWRWAGWTFVELFGFLLAVLCLFYLVVDCFCWFTDLGICCVFWIFMVWVSGLVVCLLLGFVLITCFLWMFCY